MALRKGDTTPKLKLKDIDGTAFSTDDYRDCVRIFSFADRHSSARLMEWLTDANIRIKQAHPSARLTYINFADVSMVPKMMQHVVRPVLRTINTRSLRQLQSVYDKAGIAEGRDDIVFHLIPDWKGAFLKAFDIPDASAYHIWIERGGVIIAELNESTGAIAEQFIDCVSALIE